GVPEFYLVLKQHPGDTLNMNLTMEGKHFEQIPAYHRNGNKKVMHLFNPVRPEQTIGYTIFASAVKDLLDGDRYMDAEKMAALEDACMTAVITTENAKTFAENFADVTGSASETFKLQHEFGTNEQWYMEPGQDVSMHKPTRPNNQLRDYMEQILSGPANAVNMPPEVYSQNFRGLNYSNARTILLNLYAAGRTWQNFMISDLCVPVWHQTASWFIQKGLIGVNTPFGLRKHDWLKSTWIPAVFRRWIDPLKEAKGKEVDLNNNIETLTDVLAEQGKDFDEHILKRGREIKKMAEVEEQLGIKFPSSGSAAQPVAEGEEEGEEAGAGSPPGSEEDQRTLIEEAVEEYIQNNTIRMLGR
ncbi:MAG: phage portal protein, partial [Thermoplasmata archaeon]|nr:phage portal protein [Thermoplasmata archaeon]